MELGENGVIGKLAQLHAMAEIKPEKDFVTAPSLAMVDMTVLLITLQVPTFNNVTRIHA